MFKQSFKRWIISFPQIWQKLTVGTTSQYRTQGLPGLCFYTYYFDNHELQWNPTAGLANRSDRKKSRYTPWWRLGGEKI
jgi:hypothetical protein